jgi:hypothetical protein
MGWPRFPIGLSDVISASLGSKSTASLELAVLLWPVN